MKVVTKTIEIKYMQKLLVEKLKASLKYSTYQTGMLLFLQQFNISL